MYIAELVWLGQRLTELGRKEMRSYAPDVPIAELIVMGDLLQNSPTTVTPLAERTGYVQSRVSTAVAALEARGWVQTEPDPADRRRTLVRVLEHIERTAQELRSSTEAQSLQQLLTDLPAERRQAITDALDDLLELLQRQTPSRSDSTTG